MTLDLTFYLFAIPAVIFVGISKGGFAGGPAFAATPFLALVLQPTQAVAFLLPILMIMDATALRPYWKKWDREATRLMILGSLPGLALGTVLFGFINADMVRLMIGAIAIAFVVFQTALSRGWLVLGNKELGPAHGLFWGGAAAFTSFISHAGGPPTAVYLLGRRLDKTTYQATTVLVFTFINASKFVCYLALGLFSWDMGVAVLTLAPVAIAGTLLGVWLHKLIEPALFFRLTYAFLLLTGAKLIFDALT